MLPKSLMIESIRHAGGAVVGASLLLCCAAPSTEEEILQQKLSELDYELTEWSIAEYREYLALFPPQYRSVTSEPCIGYAPYSRVTPHGASTSELENEVIIWKLLLHCRKWMGHKHVTGEFDMRTDDLVGVGSITGSFHEPEKCVVDLTFSFEPGAEKASASGTVCGRDAAGLLLEVPRF